MSKAAARSPDDGVGPQHRPRIGLALSGGGARGFSHVGVLKALEAMRIPIDCIAGTSAGAAVGAAYSVGLAPNEIEAQLRSADWDMRPDGGCVSGDRTSDSSSASRASATSSAA